MRPLTARHLREAAAKLVSHFGDKPITAITGGDGQDFAAAMFARFAPNTARRIIGRGKQFFVYAVRKGLIQKNPFGDMRGLAVRPNRERDYYVDAEQSQRILEVLPTPAWRTLFCVARFCGLRIPSESAELTWNDVDWARGRLIVRSTKTAREGKAVRFVPLFAEAKAALSELFEVSREGELYVIADFREWLLKRQGLQNANLRTQLTRYILQAGLMPWPKLWSNLRRSCAIDLAMRFPSFAVSEWTGHTQAVSEAFYLRITPELEAGVQNFRRIEAKQNAKQQTAAPGGKRSQTPSLPIPQVPNPPLLAPLCQLAQTLQIPPRGVELVSVSRCGTVGYG